MKLALASTALAFVSIVVATTTGCSGSQAGADAAPTSDVEAGPGLADAAPPPKTPLVGSSVIVNGLLGDAIGDIRVCPAKGPGVALPNARPMPLANYPGIPRGHGLDLGNIDVSNGLDVFAASAIAGKIETTCSELRDGFPYVRVSPPASEGANAWVLVDDPQGNVSVVQIALNLGAAPTEGRVAGQFAHVVDGVSGPLTLTSGPTAAQTGTGQSSTGFLVTGPEATLKVSDGGKFTYEQSLASIQHVADPTTTPSAFYGTRTQFLFLLLGDPKNPYLGWKSPEGITGKELHITAIPFVVQAKGRP